MSVLSQELLGHKASFVLSVETLCLELQMIADEFHEAGGSVSRFFSCMRVGVHCSYATTLLFVFAVLVVFDKVPAVLTPVQQHASPPSLNGQ